MNSLDYLGVLSLKTDKKNEKGKHIIQISSEGGDCHNVSFLPNDPLQFINRMLLLLGSKKAGNTGNNNCFKEASAILDDLMTENI